MKIRRLTGATTLAETILDYDLAQADDQPNNILEKIVWHKQAEVVTLAQEKPLDQILAEIDNAPIVRDFYASLLKSELQPSLIAEVKKASPSKGVIRPQFDPVAIAQTYADGGAACLSVLTDAQFFEGSFSNLEQIRAAVNLPLLCKEFIISAYQIYYARTCGADAVLLITAILNDNDLFQFAELIYQLGMTALIEVHSQAELDRVMAMQKNLKPNQTLIGINNRNLETFTVDLNVTKTLLGNLSAELKNRWLWVSESGIHTAQDLELVANSGVGAVLVGESLLKQPDLKAAIANLYAI